MREPTSSHLLLAALLAWSCSDSESGAGDAAADPSDASPEVAVDGDRDDQAGDGPSDGVPDGPVDVTDFDVQGHRGARGLKPENTLPGFEHALDLGVDTLELDLHYSQDDVVVIWHDRAVSALRCRIDPDAEAPLPPDPDNPDTDEDALMIRGLTVAQLAKYRCDRNPDPDTYPEQNSDPTLLAGDGYHIATLAELFDLVEVYAADERKSEEQRAGAAIVGFNVETKRDVSNPETIGDGFDGENAGPFEIAIVSLLQERGLVERTVLQSFDLRSLRAARPLDDDLRLAALTRLEEPAFDAYVEDGFAVWSPLHAGATEPRLAAAHQAGLAVVPWTVNAEAAMRRLIDRGVDGLISDRPDILIEVVDSYR